MHHDPKVHDENDMKEMHAESWSAENSYGESVWDLNWMLARGERMFDLSFEKSRRSVRPDKSSDQVLTLSLSAIVCAWCR